MILDEENESPNKSYRMAREASITQNLEFSGEYRSPRFILMTWVWLHRDFPDAVFPDRKRQVGMLIAGVQALACAG